MSQAIAAIATGGQVSAIGIVRMSGDGVIPMASRLFRPADGKSLEEHAPHSLVYGRLEDREGALLDLCLCTYSVGPASYTGEDTVEFQCHGSPMLLTALIEELFTLGARQAGPGEFTKRAFLNGRMDLSQAEAVADVIEAESGEALRNAAGQLSGAMSRKIQGIYSGLTDICAHYHAVLDYPDEDIEDFRVKAYELLLRDSLESLHQLLAGFERGKHLNSGIPTAIIGRPNAGKSSLMNALLGFDRAIVTDIPGTTRDTIEERVRFGGLSLRLTDTAGIRNSQDPVERLGVERSRAALRQAELVLALLDGSIPGEDGEQEILAAAEAAPKALVLLTKSDLPRLRQQVETRLPVLPVSSHSREGLEKLEKAMEDLFPLPAVPAGELLTNTRQAGAVRTAAENMEAALEAMEAGQTPDIVLTEVEQAMSALGELSGRSIRQDVTDRIFARFCVGK